MMLVAAGSYDTGERTAISLNIQQSWYDCRRRKKQHQFLVRIFAGSLTFSTLSNSTLRRLSPTFSTRRK
jgi:hypothetical protein